MPCALKSVPTAAHGHEEVKYGPGEDHDVVDVHPAGHDGGRVADALEQRRDLEDTQAPDRQHLAERQLHEEHWDAGQKQGQEVRDQEGPAPVFVTQVGKPPDVSQADGQADLFSSSQSVVDELASNFLFDQDT